MHEFMQEARVNKIILALVTKEQQQEVIIHLPLEQSLLDEYADLSP